jgi:hypothetical protein
MNCSFRYTLYVAVFSSTLAAAQQLPEVPRDSSFPVELRQTIRASTAKVGDPVKLRTVESVLTGKGIVIPNGTPVLGTIQEVRDIESGVSEIRIRIHTLLVKDRAIPVNLAVSSLYYARSAYPNATGRENMFKLTFLEGIKVVSRQSEEASTSFSSQGKEVVLRSGIMLKLRQIDPTEFRPAEQQVASRK